MVLPCAGPGFDLGAVGPYDRFFFAALPEGQARDRAWSLADAEQLRVGRPDYRTPRSCLHVSLAMVAVGLPVSAAGLRRAGGAAGRVTMPRFRVSLNRVESFRGAPRPRVLTGEDGVIGLDLLHAELCAALSASGFAVRRVANFNPHMTLMRDRRDTPLRHVAPVAWEVSEFVLVHSHHGQGRYTLLGRWPLAARR